MVVRTLSLAAVLGAVNGCLSDDVGGPDGDGPPACDMEIVSTFPAQPGAGDTVVIMARIVKENAPGIETFAWEVTLDGTAVTFAPEGIPDAREIMFAAESGGTYTVTLNGEVGDLACMEVVQTIEVSAATAGLRHAVR
jgi:hypothetical protein